MAKDDKNLLLVAQEVKLVKILAGNNKKLRERTIKRLSKWLNDRSTTAPLTEDALMRIWKGLFYAMWMSDKPLIQEDCAENIANLMHVDDVIVSLLYFKCFLQTMVNEWYGIDHHRIDKFLMLVRRVFRQIFEVLRQNEWDGSSINQFREILNQTALKIEELAKVSKGDIAGEKVLELIQPFTQQLARSDDNKETQFISKHIFKHLINQTDVALEHKEKFKAWRQQGFPGGTIDSMEAVPVEEDVEDLQVDEEDLPKDPRAGKVDVVLPQLQFDPLEVVKLLEDVKFKKYTTNCGRKSITNLIRHFKQLANGVYPYGLTKIKGFDADNYISIKSSVKKLQNFQNSMTHDSKRSKSKILKRKRAKEFALQQVENSADTKNEDKLSENTTNNTKHSKKQKQAATFDEFVSQSEGHLFGNKKVAQTAKSKQKVQKMNGTPAITEIQKYVPIKSQNHFKRNSGIWTVDEYEMPESPKPDKSNPRVENNVSEWEKPLKNGETEIFVVSKKSKMKLKRLAASKNQPVCEIVDDFTQKIMKNTPKNSKVVRNPFSEKLTPKSEKKIKFSNKIHAQEFKEHEMQLITSPVIPYDATKRPTKGLLKPSPFNSPINPFYNINQI